MSLLDPPNPTPWNLLQAQNVQEYMEKNPESRDCTVLSRVVWYLERGYLDEAQYKIKLDSDKFDYRHKRKLLTFLHCWGLLDDEYARQLAARGAIEV